MTAFLPFRASAAFENSSASFSTFLHPHTTSGRSTASAISFSSPISSSVDLFAPFGSPPSIRKLKKSTPSIEAAFLAISARVAQPS